jgi:hypothetical protein
MRANKCQDPYKCYETAKLILNSLKTKWNPNQPTIEPSEVTKAINKAIDNLSKNNFDHIFFNNLSIYTKKENSYHLFLSSFDSWPEKQIKVLLPSENNPSKQDYYLDATTIGIQSTNPKGGFGILTPNNQIIQE